MKPWNDDAGDWQNLDVARQAPRYQALARIIATLCPHGSVLDVGCGEAVLMNYLSAPTEYWGIEPSEKAVKSARIKNGRECIVHTTAEGFDAGQRQWDCIIFNEMLYYTAAPVALVCRYSRLLQPKGIVVISIFQKPERSFARRLFWRALRGVITNVRCTRAVQDFMTRNQWSILTDELVAVPGTHHHWRVLAARPSLNNCI